MKKIITKLTFRPVLFGLALATGVAAPLASEAMQAPLLTRTATTASDILLQLRANTPLTAALVNSLSKSAGVKLTVTRNLGAGSYLLRPTRAVTAQTLQAMVQKLKANPAVFSAALYQTAVPRYVVTPNGHSITLSPTSLQKNSTPIVQYRWQQFLGTPVKMSLNRSTAALIFTSPATIQRNDVTTPAGTMTGTTPATSPGVNPGDLTGAPASCSTAGAPNFAFFHAFSAAFHIIDATRNLRDLSLAATQTTISMADHEVAVNGDTKDFSFSGSPGAISGTIHLLPVQGNGVDASFNGNPAFATGTYHTVDASGKPVDHTFHTTFTGVLGDVAPFTTDKNGFLCNPTQTPATSALVPGPLDSGSPTPSTTPATPTTGTTPAADPTSGTITSDPNAGTLTGTPAVGSTPTAGSAPAVGTSPVVGSSPATSATPVTTASVRTAAQPSTILGFRLIATDKAGVSHVTNVYVRVHKPSSIIKRLY